MFRKLTLALLVTAAGAIGFSTADAGPISSNNPYRSFNISGINYGSQNWERSHGGRSYGHRTSGNVRHGLLFRRR